MVLLRGTFVLLIPGLLLLNGCATDNPQTEIDRQILEASEKIQTAQADLYQAGALNETTTKRPISIVDDQQRVTVAWHGDALQLLSKLARDRQLAFSYMGIRMPLPVGVDVKNMPYEKLLAMIRAQVGYRATIIQSNESILLHYNAPQS